jgi:DNA-directed RNA polymerase alpha subunit
MENKNLIKISGSTLIADCPLSTRIKHILNDYEIETINDVLRVPPHKLIRFRNLGAKSIAELHEFLIDNDFHFGKEQ